MALRVLLADESTTIKKVMQLALQDFAVEVKAVHAGVDVIEVAKAFKPDIVFADVLLQKKNGYEVCAEIKGERSLRHLPVVLMWSSFLEVDERLARDCGADERLEKPFDVETLRQLILQLVPNTRSQRLAHFLDFSEAVVQPLKTEIEHASAQAKIASRLTHPGSATRVARAPQSPAATGNAPRATSPPPAGAQGGTPAAPRSSAPPPATPAQAPAPARVPAAGASPAAAGRPHPFTSQTPPPTGAPSGPAVPQVPPAHPSSRWNMESFDEIDGYSEDVSLTTPEPHLSAVHEQDELDQDESPHLAKTPNPISYGQEGNFQPGEHEETDENPHLADPGVQLSDFSLDDADDAHEGFSEFKLSDLSKSPRLPAETLVDYNSDEASSYHERPSSEDWSHQDLSAFKIDLAPVPVQGEDFALTFDANQREVEGTGYTPSPDLNEPETPQPAPYAPRPQAQVKAAPGPGGQENAHDLGRDLADDLALELDDLPVPKDEFEVQPLDDPYQAPRQPMPAEFSRKLAPQAAAHSIRGHETRSSSFNAREMPATNAREMPATNAREMPATNARGVPAMSEERLEEIIRAQSQEVIEALVRRLVPDIATEIIQRELARLLDDPPRPE